MSTALSHYGFDGHSDILANVNRILPKAHVASKVFFKSHSQFMAATVDAQAITPIRAIKQTLAVIERTRAALEEASYNVRKNDIEIRRKCSTVYQDALQHELAELEAEELNAKNNNIKNFMCGAIRKLSAYLEQYNNLMCAIGKSELTEEDYERDEARYHIMTAMKQALTAARARGGIIDEGNLIYLFDIGINGAQAQAEVTAYLAMEIELLSDGKAPTHEMTVRWLEACADKWIDCPMQWAERRGMTTLDELSLLPPHSDVTSNNRSTT